MAAVEFDLTEHNGYFQCVVRGDVPDGALGFDPYEDLPTGGRLIIDATGLGEINRPHQRWAAMAINLELRGIRVAVVVRDERQFDLYTEALVLARVDTGKEFSVFRDFTEGLAWLLRDRPADFDSGGQRALATDVSRERTR